MFTVLSGVSLDVLQPSTGSGGQLNPAGSSGPKQAPALGSATQGDTVKLSVTQKVRNLHSEGEGPGQIATSLGLTSTQVNGDLYVSLTWPQLLSKVASSSLSLGTTSSDESSHAVFAAGSAPADVSAPTGKSNAALSGVPGFGAAKSDAVLGGVPAFGAAKQESAPSGDRVFGAVAQTRTTDAVAA